MVQLVTNLKLAQLDHVVATPRQQQTISYQAQHKLWQHYTEKSTSKLKYQCLLSLYTKLSGNRRVFGNAMGCTVINS